MKLSSIHSAKNDLNISVYLLKLLGLNGKKLKTNNRNDTKNLSFRLLSKFCLISEEKIIRSSSPIYTDQYTEETQNKSLFKLLLTGKDDDDLEAIKNIKTYRSKISGKLELIQATITEKNKRLSIIRERVEKLGNDELNLKIEELVKIVNEVQQKVLAEEQKRQTVWSEIYSLTGSLNQNEELIHRFELLDQHYKSDLQRLEFVNEGKQYLDQIKKVNCPVCDSLIEQRLLESYEDNDPGMLNSVKSEYLKIQSKQTELKETIANLKVGTSTLQDKIKEKQDEFSTINNFIAEKLKPIHEVNYKNLQNFLSLRDDRAQIGLIEEEISKLKSDIDYYHEKLSEKKERVAEEVLPEDIYDNLSKEIKKILAAWGVQHKTIRYDPTDSDIVIDGEKRQNFGKGYRAIYLSAFMIAIMFYCFRNKLKHPYFLVLDSPLTSYKERDKATGDNIDPKDRLPDDLPSKFYKSISELPHIDDVQIIVIDNTPS